jgi:DNA-binding MarR family transcriptional regulator
MSKQLARTPQRRSPDSARSTTGRSGTAEDPDTAYRLQFAVSLLARRLRRETGTGLTPSQLSVLSTVHRSGPLTLGELADCEQVAPPTITRVVAKLERAGYLRRLPDPEDRRVARVQLTEDASLLVVAARQAKADWVLARLGQLTPAQQRRLLAAVDAIEALAELG